MEIAQIFNFERSDMFDRNSALRRSIIVKSRSSDAGLDSDLEDSGWGAVDDDNCAWTSGCNVEGDDNGGCFDLGCWIGGGNE